MERSLILAGDIGGTHTRLGLYESSAHGLRRLRDHSARHDPETTLETEIASFLSEEHGAVSAACFGIAGPVIEGRGQLTNLGWHVDEEMLRRAAGASAAFLLNDLAATAFGMCFLDDDAWIDLQTGERRDGNVAVIAAGTGLGEALLVRDGNRYLPVATEAGHAGFAPHSPASSDLLAFLRASRDPISVERVVSGPGLARVYDWLRASATSPEPERLRKLPMGGDRSAWIAEAALAGEDPVCERALELFVECYGSEAGNLALRSLALGGVWIGGGIAPKILDALLDGRFLAAFLARGRFEDLLRRVPVRVCTRPDTALLGAAHWAGTRILDRSP